jgi:signal transduction histidine kinase
MRARAQEFLRRPGPIGPDGALAIALTILLQAELWLGERYQSGPAFPGSKIGTAPFLLIATMALAWRRRHPTLTLATVMGALAVQSVATGGTEAGGGFLLVLIAVYSAAAYGEHPLWTVAIAVGGLAVHDLEDPYVHTVVDVAFPFTFAAAGFALGRVLHHRGVRSRLLAEEAARARGERDRRASEAVAAERQRIARELHDVVAHSVSVMVVQSLAGQSALQGDEPETRQALRTIERTGRQAMAEMRRLLTILREDREPGAAPQPGAGQLGDLVEETRRAGLDIDFREEGDGRRLPPGVGLALYRITQEALTNSLRHSGNGHADVLVTYGDRHVTLRVANANGNGAAPSGVSDAGGGFGIPGMRERAALYGGDLRAGPGDGGAFVVEARLPLSDSVAT